MMTKRRLCVLCFLLATVACIAIGDSGWAAEEDVRLVYVESKKEFVPPQSDQEFGETCVVSQDGKNVYVVRAGQLIIYERNRDDGTLKMVKFSRPRGAGIVAHGPDNETLLIGGGRWLVTYQRDPETRLLEMRQEIKGPVFSTDTGVYGAGSKGSSRIKGVRTR